ncbi:19375_t:CDS:1, partial [Gigaspora rosea]
EYRSSTFTGHVLPFLMAITQTCKYRSISVYVQIRAYTLEKERIRLN